MNTLQPSKTNWKSIISHPLWAFLFIPLAGTVFGLQTALVIHEMVWIPFFIWFFFLVLLALQNKLFLRIQTKVLPKKIAIALFTNIVFILPFLYLWINFGRRMALLSVLMIAINHLQLAFHSTKSSLFYYHIVFHSLSMIGLSNWIIHFLLIGYIPTRLFLLSIPILLWSIGISYMIKNHFVRKIEKSEEETSPNRGLGILLVRLMAIFSFTLGFILWIILYRTHFSLVGMIFIGSTFPLYLFGFLLYKNYPEKSTRIDTYYHFLLTLLIFLFSIFYTP